MNTLNELKDIFEKIAAGTATKEDIETLRQFHEGHERILIQYGKSVVNIGQGQGVQIGDRTYIELNDKALQALIQAIGANQNNDLRDNYFIFAEACSDRQSVNQYFEIILQRLRQQGSLDIRQNLVRKGKNFNYIAKIADFEIPFGLFSMRGEAFFMFSEFASINIKTLQQFSAQCMQLAQKQVNPSALGQAVWNFRVPTHLCFAIAIVDKVDEKTKTEIQITNPIDQNVDLLWYTLPIVYELNQQKLYFYDKPSSFLENFKAELVWQKLRMVVQEMLMP